jgi:predicted alpha/beta superfamily hydrolase
MRAMKDTLRDTFQRVLRLENRRAAARPGRIERIDGFQSQILPDARNLTIYLPPGYEDRKDRRYPVLYLQDGQNLFEPERAFVPGQHWRLREAADEAIAERTASPMILVGIDNTGPARMDEYTPTTDEKHNAGGRAADYGRMVVDEIKPLIDARFRTLPFRENVGIGGSSLGGLLSLYLVLSRSEVFGFAAVMSPSVWWDNRSVLRTVEAFRSAEMPRPRIWLDIGGREGTEALTDAQTLRDRLRAKGWSDSDFHYHEDRRADHSERAWAKRARMVLEFLFPPQ